MDNQPIVQPSPIPGAGMKPMQPMPMPMAPKKSSGALIAGIVAVVVVIAAVWWLRRGAGDYGLPSPTPLPSASGTPISKGLQQEINAVGTTNIDAEFQAIDTDLKAL